MNHKSEWEKLKRELVTISCSFMLHPTVISKNILEKK